MTTGTTEDLDRHEQEVGDMPHEDSLTLWSRWKKQPTPENMAVTLKSVAPIIQKSVAKYPKYNSSVLGGEAKRLAIAAIKSYSPDQGAKLTSHIYNHLKPLSRFTADLGSAVRKSRLEKSRTHEYLSAVNDLTEEFNREPTDHELSDRLGVNSKVLDKYRNSATGEAAESQLEFLPGQDEDPRLSMWTEYVYHDLDPKSKLIMDYKMGRNGKPMLDTEGTAAKLGLHPDYVNRRAADIASKILDGASSAKIEEPEDTGIMERL